MKIQPKRHKLLERAARLVEEAKDLARRAWLVNGSDQEGEGFASWLHEILIDFMNEYIAADFEDEYDYDPELSREENDDQAVKFAVSSSFGSDEDYDEEEPF